MLKIRVIKWLRPNGRFMAARSNCSKVKAHMVIIWPHGVDISMWIYLYLHVVVRSQYTCMWIHIYIYIYDYICIYIYTYLWYTYYTIQMYMYYTYMSTRKSRCSCSPATCLATSTHIIGSDRHPLAHLEVLNLQRQFVALILAEVAIRPAAGAKQVRHK